MQNYSNFISYETNIEALPEGRVVLTVEEYIKRINFILENNENTNEVDSDINNLKLLINEKDQLIQKLSPYVHSDWQIVHRKYSDKTTRPKPINGNENCGEPTIDILNTDFDGLSDHRKNENIQAAKVALELVYLAYEKGEQFDGDFVKRSLELSHYSWLDRNPRIFLVKKGEVDFERDYNNKPEIEKDRKIILRAIEFFIINKMSNTLGAKLHGDWQDIFRSQNSDLTRFKDTNDEQWIKNNGGSNRVDILNTDYSDLPDDWKEENKKAAEQAIKYVYSAIENEEIFDNNFIEEASSESHDAWRERNSRVYDEKDGNPKLAKDYEFLDEKEKEKNRLIVNDAIELLINNGIGLEFNESKIVNDELVFSEFDFEDDSYGSVEKILSNVLELYKDGNKNIEGFFKDYYLENKTYLDKTINSYIDDLNIIDVTLVYKLAYNIQQNNDSFKNIINYIEDKYDSNLLFHYFKYFSKTRINYAENKLLEEELFINDNYDLSFNKSAKTYNIGVANDLIISGDRDLLLTDSKKAEPSFYYKKGDDKEFLKGNYGKLLNNYRYFDDIDNSSYLLELLHNPLFLKEVESKMGFKFRDYPFSIQPRFMKFLSEAKFDDFLRIKDLFDSGKTKEDKYNRINSFIGTFNNDNFSEIILRLGEEDNLSGVEKNIIFEKYNNIVEQIDVMSELVFDNYNKLLESDNRSTVITYELIRNNLLNFAGSFFDKIIYNLEKGQFELTYFIDNFERFSVEMNSLFILIEGLSINEIEYLSLEKIPNFNFNKFLSKDLLVKESGDKYKQVKNILINKFSKNDFKAFKDDFLEDNSSNIYTLDNENKILYMVGTRNLKVNDDSVLYIDWLASSPELEGFSLKLTENFLKNQLGLGEFSDKNIEALGEPDILTPYLFIEKFGFVVNGTSDTPETGEYGKKGNYFRLQKNSNKEYLSVGKTLEEINSLKEYNDMVLKEFIIKDSNQEFLNYIDHMKSESYVMTRMIKQTTKNNNKKFLTVFEKNN